MNKIGKCYKAKGARWFFRPDGAVRGVACKVPSITGAVLNTIRLRFGKDITEQIKESL